MVKPSPAYLISLFKNSEKTKRNEYENERGKIKEFIFLISFFMRLLGNEEKFTPSYYHSLLFFFCLFNEKIIVKEIFYHNKK